MKKKRDLILGIEWYWLALMGVGVVLVLGAICLCIYKIK